MRTTAGHKIEPGRLRLNEGFCGDEDAEELLSTNPQSAESRSPLHHRLWKASGWPRSRRKGSLPAGTASPREHEPGGSLATSICCSTVSLPVIEGSVLGAPARTVVASRRMTCM